MSKEQSEMSSLARSRLRAKQRQKKQMQSLRFTVIGAFFIVAALIIAMSIPARQRDHPMADGNAMGNPNAPVVMVDFSDYQCSHCRNFFQYTEPDIIEKYIATGKVYFIFRSFGDSPRGDSGRAAQASYCAGDQGKFWEMHDIIFTNFSYNDDGSYSIENLTEMAKEIEIEVSVFEDCMKGEKYKARVDEDKSTATEKGVTGTPTFFINDQMIVGNQPLDTFIQVIESELEKVEE